MGGWLGIIGDEERLTVRCERLQRVFAVDGVPPLKVEGRGHPGGFGAVLWAWNARAVPDVYFEEDQGVILLAAGAITEWGGLSAIASNQEEAVQKILELYLRDGEGIIERINGSFSLVFYDRRSRRTTLFVDRFASRSVWIGKDGQVPVIGNFPAAIAAMKNESPRLSPAGLWSFFHAGRQAGTQGLYSGLRALMAGEKAVIDGNGQIQVSRWWKRRYQPQVGLSPVRWGERLASAIADSAGRYRHISKSPYLFLSGGLDSRIAAAAWGQPLKAISLCTQPNAETRIACRIARILGLEHQVIVRSPYWYYDTINASALVGSGLYLSQHAHFIRPVQQVVAQDEEAEFLLGDLLENFNKHYFSAPTAARLSLTADTAIEVLYHWAPYRVGCPGRLGKHFNKDIRQTLEESYRASISEYLTLVQDVSDEPEDCLDTFFRWANVGVTPTYNMITGMWPLAKERNIGFDNALNESSLRIPAHLRGRGVLHRWILYHLNRKILFVPDANTFLPPLFTPRARTITKKIRPWLGKLRRNIRKVGAHDPRLQTSGSWLLLHELYRKDERYRGQIERLIFDKNVFPPEIFEPKEIKRTWANYLQGDISLHFDVEALRSFGSLQQLTPFSRLDL